MSSVQPTWPPAPPLFTTTIGWPSDLSAIAARMRAATSVPPPAGNATMSCTGRLGKVGCAPALLVAAAKARAAPMEAVTMRGIIDVLLLVDCRSGTRFTHLGRRQMQQRDDEDGDRDQQQAETE